MKKDLWGGRDRLGSQIHDHPWAWDEGRLFQEVRRVTGCQRQRGQVVVLLCVGP